jgi:acyl carrier protein
MTVTAADILKTFEIAIPKDVMARLDPDKPFLEQGVDSLGLTAMAVALQNVYGVKIGVEDGLRLKTLNDAAAFVNRYAKQTSE